MSSTGTLDAVAIGAGVVRLAMVRMDSVVSEGKRRIGEEILARNCGRVPSVKYVEGRNLRTAAARQLEPDL